LSDGQNFFGMTVIKFIKKKRGKKEGKKKSETGRCRQGVRINEGWKRGAGPVLRKREKPRERGDQGEKIFASFLNW